MASFQNMVITTAGLELLQDLILEGGTPLTFSGVGVGDGLLEDSDITARTSLVHEVHRLPIEKIEKQEGGHIRVFARLATDIITTDFYHRELGVFTRNGEQEILFAYGNAGDDYDFIPATGNNASICKTIVTEFTVGSMKAVFLPLDSSDLVTHSSLNERMEQIKSGDNAWGGKQTFVGAVVCADGLSVSDGKKITLSNGGATIHANVNNSTVHVSSLASAGGVSGNVVNCNRVNSAALAITGTATFSAGVTMEQSLNVSGRATLKGGLGVGGSIVCYDDYGVQAATITGVYLSPDESGVVFGNSGSADFLRIKYHALSKYVDIHLLIPGSSLHLPTLAPISVDGSCSADSFQFGPNSIGFVPSNPTMVTTSGFWNFGGASFSGGVTMDSGLYVAGNLVCAGSISGTFTGSFKGTLDSLVRLDFAFVSGGNPDFYWGCVNPDMLCLNRARKGATQPYPLLSVTPDGVTMPRDFVVVGSATFSGRVSKQSQEAPLDATDTPNREEGDARWVKFNNTLTDAQYAALAVKDQTTMYITDTGKIYLGSYALN